MELLELGRIQEVCRLKSTERFPSSDSLLSLDSGQVLIVLGLSHRNSYWYPLVGEVELTAGLRSGGFTEKLTDLTEVSGQVEWLNLGSLEGRPAHESGRLSKFFESLEVRPESDQSGRFAGKQELAEGCRRLEDENPTLLCRVEERVQDGLIELSRLEEAHPRMSRNELRTRPSQKNDDDLDWSETLSDPSSSLFGSHFAGEMKIQARSRRRNERERCSHFIFNSFSLKEDADAR